MSPARPNRAPLDDEMMYDEGVLGNAERRALGYATLGAWRERVAATMAGGLYIAPGTRGSTTTTTEAICTQTEELPTRDVGVGVTDNLIEGERKHELELGLCAPHDLPLMSVSQLLEAERRLSDLLNRLESEIVRAEAQQERQRAQEVEGAAEADAKAFGTYGRFLTTDEWTKRFATSIDRRLRRRYGDIEGVTPAMFWHRTKAESVASPPRRHMATMSPERERVAKFAAMPSLLAADGSILTGKNVGGARQQGSPLPPRGPSPKPGVRPRRT
jgi:hypothetical protein